MTTGTAGANTGRAWSAWPAVVLHLAIVLPLAALLNIWVDEAFSFDTSGGSFARTITQSLNFEYQPPLYFLVLWAWRLGTTSAFWARLLSILCSAGSVALVPALWRRYVPGARPFWPSIVIATSPFLVWTAVEIRCYAMVVLAAIVLLLLIHDAFLADPPRTKLRPVYAVTALAALYLQYYLGFLLVAGAFALVLARRWRVLWTYVLVNALVALGLAPIVRTILWQVSTGGGGDSSDVHWVGAFKNIWYHATNFVIAAAYPTPRPIVILYRITLVLFVLALGWFAVRRPQRLFDPAFLRVLLLVAVVALAFVGLTHMVTPDLSAPRHAASLMPLVMLLAFSAFHLLGGPRAVAPVALVLLAFNAVALEQAWRPLAKVGDWARVARYIEREERPNEPIFVFHAASALPLKYHYHGVNRIHALPHDQEFDTWDVVDYALHGTDELRGIFAAFDKPEAPKRFWLATDNGTEFFGVSFHREILDQFVSENFDLESDRRFHGSQVRCLVPKRKAAR